MDGWARFDALVEVAEAERINLEKKGEMDEKERRLWRTFQSS